MRWILRRINFLGRRIPVPRNIVLRVGLGVALVFGGAVGFLPIVGYWMLPFGLLILSIDFPPVRRFQRRMTVRLGHFLQKRWPGLAARMGMTERRANRR
jgi:purine-cytosine permease-like protein